MLRVMDRRSWHESTNRSARPAFLSEREPRSVQLHEAVGSNRISLLGADPCDRACSFSLFLLLLDHFIREIVIVDQPLSHRERPIFLDILKCSIFTSTPLLARDLLDVSFVGSLALTTRN